MDLFGELSWSNGRNHLELIHRMFFLHIQALVSWPRFFCLAPADDQYNLFNLVFSWFALANLWLTFSIVIELVPTSTKINIFVTADIVSWLVLRKARADL